MSERVDFHIHSNKSCDGDFSPAEIVGLAAGKGFRAISIADHDTVAAYPDAVRLGRKAGVEVIPGIEVTTLFKGREFHLLLPFVEWASPAVGEIVETQSRCRMDEAFERVERIRGLGLDITWDEVRQKANGMPPLGIKIAQILLDKPESRANPALEFFFREENRAYAPNMFYKAFFAEGKPGFVPKKFAGLVKILDAAADTGGVPVLAHPGAYFQKTTRDDLRILKKHGLAGLEVYTFYHTPEQVDLYKGLAEALDLVPTAGSDFHGRIKPHVAFGALADGRYWMVERLRERKGKKS